MTDLYDILIIGSGPAGYTASIYASRANLKTLVFDGPTPGGALTTTTMVENFPGFPQGIMGGELMRVMREQAAHFGTQFVNEIVTGVDFSKQPLTVMAGEKSYQARAVLISTGSKPRMLGLESEKQYLGRGVGVCATCDGFFFRNKTVAVIGGGDSAMEEAMFLTKFATKVYVVNWNFEFKASKIMVERAKANPKIEFIMNKQVSEVVGEKVMTGLKLRDSTSNEITDLKADGMFLAIGRIPNTEFLKTTGILNGWGYVERKHNTMTAIPGVFAAGDCADTRYWQGIVAAGDGAKAAIDAERWLEGEKA